MSGLDRSEAGAEASRAKAQKVFPAAAKGETHASNGWPGKATLRLREAWTAQRNGLTAVRNVTRESVQIHGIDTVMRCAMASRRP
jgi:hypothetical protein